jgi:hypothetical protein
VVSVQAACSESGSLQCKEAALLHKKSYAFLLLDIQIATCDIGGLRKSDQADEALKG